jgi:hypothetical protein
VSQQVLTSTEPDVLPASWDDVQRRASWSALLIGNGASRAVWDGFSYGSLFEVARNVAHPLGVEDEVIFERLQTRDFEQALLALKHARIVAEALGLAHVPIDERYMSIQLALAEAVSQVHVPWDMMPAHILRNIRKVLSQHRYVFSTNYDLLIYWAILIDDPRPRDVKDFFWTGANERWLVFEPWDTDVGPYVTRVLYLHGGLHLYHLPDGRSGKYVPPAGTNLLEAFRAFMTEWQPDGPIPLLVAEGDAEDKFAAIGSSDYLSFAYKELVHCDEPLVVFGQSLGDSDAHIVEALRVYPNRPVAVSVHARSSTQVQRTMAHYRKVLPEAPLHFFDAVTNPLGSSDLRVTGTPEAIP